MPWQGFVAFVLVALLALPAAARYPYRPVTVIHNYGPGTASDATAQSITEAFSAHRDGATGWHNANR